MQVRASHRLTSLPLLCVLRPSLGRPRWPERAVLRAEVLGWPGLKHPVPGGAAVAWLAQRVEHVTLDL